MIAVIDYGVGNLFSLKCSLAKIGEDAVISGEKECILSADRIILPGVGAFSDAAQKLNNTGLAKVLKEAADSNIPILGICLGMQLLFDSSEETPGVPGLGIFSGDIVKISKQDGYKIPHMGWNSLSFPQETPLFQGLPDTPFVYFVHSFYAKPKDLSIVAATTNYCGELTVAIRKDNIFATQFHPEKSGDVGLSILKNFLDARGNF